MKIDIYRDEITGFVEYDEEVKEVDVFFPDEIFEKLVKRHLTAKQKFRIPESNKIDDFREDFVVPTDERTYMELALCTLLANTDVQVNWETLED